VVEILDRQYTVDSMTTSAGIVLAGGRSSRMGTPKASLEWHGSTLLRHVTGVVDRAVDGPVIVVRAPGQELPELDPKVVVFDDPEEGRGPMQGLAVGLAAAAEYAETAFVCSTDLPFMHALLSDPRLASVDPDLDSIVNVNEPDDYSEARARPAPEVVVERYGVLATRGGARGPRTIRAASIGAAAEQVGLAFDGHILAAINGDQIRSDGRLPLLAGDTVSFISADAGG